ncbi:MAG: cytochrome-c oxidase, cbb3-type subunit III [Burkholderiales bacterium]|jgi:cytochrome c oxidase cbb3-type subunit 3|nr:cytochrome-c oxidase, cbb3-type subunit III [Burkholderiales bacterium]
MSDFVHDGWSFYIAIITVVSLLACGVFLKALSTQKLARGEQAGTTGHTWDGLQELNNPMPRWWMWLFYITIVFSFAYLILYPGLGSYAGYLGWSSQGQYKGEQQQAAEVYGPVIDRFLKQDVLVVAANPEAREIGQRLFLNYCAQCHGSDAGGSRGYPSLRDADWLYGGTTDAIRSTILNGRNGVMPPLGAALGGSDEVRDVVHHVLALAGRTHDGLRAQRGKAKFATTCVACHGADGKGNQQIGAPNLSDDIWLHGGTEAAITESIVKGRMNQMPGHKDFLDEGKIHLLTAYVLGISGRVKP